MEPKSDKAVISTAEVSDVRRGAGQWLSWRTWPPTLVGEPELSFRVKITVSAGKPA